MNQKFGFVPGFMVGVISSLMFILILSSKRESLSQDDHLSDLRTMGVRGQQQRTTFPTSPDYIGMTEATKKDILLFILIHSTPHALDSRNVIRRTWLDLS